MGLQMSEQRYSYATVGVNDDRSEPVVALGKRNATFEIGGEEFDRTATLRLPERMNRSEFDQWKSRESVDLIDIYFHCLHQKPIPPISEEAGDGADRPDGEAQSIADGGQSTLVTDGGVVERVDYVVEIDGKNWYSLSPHSEYDAIHCIAGALLAGADEVKVHRRVGE